MGLSIIRLLKGLHTDSEFGAGRALRIGFPQLTKNQKTSSEEIFLQLPATYFISLQPGFSLNTSIGLAKGPSSCSADILAEMTSGVIRTLGTLISWLRCAEAAPGELLPGLALRFDNKWRKLRPLVLHIDLRTRLVLSSLSYKFPLKKYKLG